MTVNKHRVIYWVVGKSSHSFCFSLQNASCSADLVANVQLFMKYCGTLHSVGSVENKQACFLRNLWSRG